MCTNRRCRCKSSHAIGGGVAGDHRALHASGSGAACAGLASGLGWHTGVASCARTSAAASRDRPSTAVRYRRIRGLTAASRLGTALASLSRIRTRTGVAGAGCHRRVRLSTARTCGARSCGVVLAPSSDAAGPCSRRRRGPGTRRRSGLGRILRPEAAVRVHTHAVLAFAAGGVGWTDGLAATRTEKHPDDPPRLSACTRHV
jgi:hypothetical protein